MTIIEATNKIFVGIDVSKDWLDIAWSSGGDVVRIDNKAAAIAAFIAGRLAAQPVCAVAFEASGGYERALAKALAAAGVTARRLHPSRVHAFAKVQPRQAKTDPIDARLIAAFAAFMPPEEDFGRDETLEDLKDMLARQTQLKAMIQAETCRHKGPGNKTLKDFIAAMLVTLKAQLKDVTALIAATIKADPLLAHRQKLLLSFKGVGIATANTILIALGAELGRIDNGKIANLVGLAPIMRQSGKHKGHARTSHGRTHVKAVLYMSAVSASRHNPAMKDLYDRLKKKGKPSKVALVAVMRKTLITLNAIIKTDKPWYGSKITLDPITV
jgi:transposase